MIQLENIALNFQGAKESLGSIDFGSIAVVAMGPHYFPLGELEQFGIHRGGDDFSDITVTETKAAGWTRAAAGDLWIRCVAEKLDGKARLKVFFENRGEGEKFAFVFFVRADGVEVLAKRYVKGSLARFQGVGHPIDLVSEHEKVRLISSDKGPLQIIPLAGGEHFWGAHFLIAFEVEEETRQKVFDFL